MGFWNGSAGKEGTDRGGGGGETQFKVLSGVQHRCGGQLVWVLPARKGERERKRKRKTRINILFSFMGGGKRGVRGPQVLRSAGGGVAGGEGSKLGSLGEPQ